MSADSAPPAAEAMTTLRPEGPRVRLERACRRYRLQMRLPIVDAYGPQHGRTFVCHGQVRLPSGTELEARTEAPNVKAARATASAQLLAQLAGLPPEHLPGPREPRPRQ